MGWKQHLISQFGHPRGALGWGAGWLMSKRVGNVQRTLATVDLLELRPGDRVLELGHGPGVGVERALAVVGRDGRVVGLERSATMRSMTARRNRTAIREGRLSLQVGDAAAPPADLGGFDAIFSSNVWLFWSDPVAVLRAYHGHLVPGGRMAVTFRPPHPDAGPVEALAAGERIAAQLDEAGYADVRVEQIPIGDVPAVCGIGIQR
jgi:SAM-dependent methyltransferase